MIDEDPITVVILSGPGSPEDPLNRHLLRITGALEESGIRIRNQEVSGDPAVLSALLADADCIVTGWETASGPRTQGPEKPGIIDEIRTYNEEIPVFVVGNIGESPVKVTLDIMRQATEYLWPPEDTPDFLAGRLVSAGRKYRDTVCPPFFRAIRKFSREFEYSWHTPGHAGGNAFRKSPAGCRFLRFFGKNLFRADLSVSVKELGSLLNHTGPIGDAEEFAAGIFGSDRTYFVTNGTSTANRIVFLGNVSAGDVVLIDRNCHKSVEHGVTMTGAVPVYLIPQWNRYGIIGPIPASRLAPERVMDLVRSTVHLPVPPGTAPVMAVITNSTYDGLCYRVPVLNDLLGASTDRILYDEAWFAYARFSPLYSDRFALCGGKDPAGPLLFATQSTHKLLAALSQGSMLHVRKGRAPFDHGRFNEAFMMLASTSPSYPLLASLDVSAKMMEGEPGTALITGCIEEAVRFRRLMARFRRDIRAASPGTDWWFDVWQPGQVTDPGTGKTVAFADAPVSLLRDTSSCWVLRPGDSWHGFSDLEPDYCMLDPIKVTVITPGIRDDGTPDATGIPAPIVAKFLESRGIISEKTGDYTLLFLFSLGVSKGRSGTLVSELFEFKRHFDQSGRISEVLPSLSEHWPDRYRNTTLRGLAEEMHRYMSGSRMGELLRAAYAEAPVPAIGYADAYRQLMKGDVERVPVHRMDGRVVATAIVPYPPGIPLLLPGERAGGLHGPVLQYLLALQEFDREFPGFAHEIHGIENAGGEFTAFCIREPGQ